MASFAAPSNPVVLQIAFVDASTPPFDVTFNKVAAAVTGGRFCHCEIAFDNVKLGKLREFLPLFHKNTPDDVRCKNALQTISNLYPPNADDELVHIAFYALQGMPLGVRVLSEHSEDPFFQKYSDAWKVYQIRDAPGKVLGAQLYWCLKQVGKPYDTMGALTCPLKSNTHELEPDRDRWWCSNHALRFVQHMAVCQDMSLRCTTPNSLEKGLQKAYKEGIARTFDEAENLEALSDQSVCDLTLDQDHWRVIGDILPSVIEHGERGWRVE